MTFKPKTENELATLPDDALIAYAVEARDAGDPDQFQVAIRIFVIGREPMVRALVADRVPERAVDDVTQEVLLSALQSLSKIKGIATGQFVNWLKKIVAFRIADYHRKREKEPGFEPIDKGEDEDDRITQILDLTGDQTGEIEVLMVLEAVLGELKPTHRLAVELRIFDDCSSIETAAVINEEVEAGEIEAEPGKEMTSSNVDKIVSRFKARMRDALGLEGTK